MDEQEIQKRLMRFRLKQAEDIAKFGRMIVGVFPFQGAPDPTNNAFVYSIGNSTREHDALPELLVIGLHNDGGIINALSELMARRGRAFDDGERVQEAAGFTMPVVVVDADDSVKDRYTLQVRAFNDGDYRVQQVVLCDKAGLFPWDPGCAKPYADVVVHRKLNG